MPRDSFWRINFSRVNWDFELTEGRYSRKKDANDKFLHEYNWVWSPQGVINMHEPEHWGYVYFSSEKPGAEVSFEIPEDDFIKYHLYNLYRAQKEYKAKHNQWATSIDMLNVPELKMMDKLIQPSLENHGMGWNIYIESPMSKKTWVITQDGKTKIK